MLEPIAVFEAVHSGNYTSFIWALVAGVVFLLLAIVFFIRPLKKVSYNGRMLLSMLAFFGFIIAASTAFFSWMAFQRASPVQIYVDAVQTSFGTARFENIIKVEMKDNKSNSFVNPNITTANNLLLFIEEKGEKVHIISDKEFEVKAIFEALDSTIGQWRDNNK